MNIKNIAIDDIAPYKKLASRAGLTFCEKTVLYGVYDMERLVGFFGLISSSKHIIVKNIYVLEDMRGRGYFKLMMDYIMTHDPQKRKVANCTYMSLREFIARGFVTVRRYKNGITKVAHENIQK